MLVKQSLTAQRSPLKAQRDKRKLKTHIVSAQSAGETKQHLRLRNASHKGAQETQANDGLDSQSQKEELMYIYDSYIFLKICTLSTLQFNKPL